MTEKNIAVIGAGYWGKNLVRNFHQLGVLKTICDSSSAIRQQMAKDYPDLLTPTSRPSSSPPLSKRPSIHRRIYGIVETATQMTYDAGK